MGAPVRPRAADHRVRTLTAKLQGSPARRAAQAIDALRHGWPLAIDDAPLLVAPETAGDVGASDRLLISGERAAILKLANQREAAAPDRPVLIGGAEPFTNPLAMAVADPSRDLATPLKGPFRAEPFGWTEAGAAALRLARLAGVLPAFQVAPERAGEPHRMRSDDIADWAPANELAIATRAPLPVASASDAEIIAFRSASDAREHLALRIGDPSREPPLVRLHSECLTGDVFGSLKCDCGPQLDGALATMAGRADRERGWGILLYVRQEGRGIGLVNKLRAYRLQEQGHDTLDANLRLGLPEEARDFPVAAAMLRLLGVGSVRLMTNNLEKVVALEEAGIRVIERVSHTPGAGEHNARYLATKRDRAGHLL